MTNPTQTKAPPIPALLVFGKPTSPDLPQASWFRVGDRQSVTAAAQALNFSLIDIQTEAERALTLGVHEGVLKGSGRMIVGSVTPEVYRRIEEYAREATGALASKASNDAAPGAKPASEQNMNLTTAGATPSAPAPNRPETPVAAPDLWDAVRVGSHVVGKYWLPDGEANGWWIGVITAINGVICESRLIQPPAPWSSELARDPAGLQAYGLSLSDLRDFGTPPRELAAHMNQALADRELFSATLPDDARI